MRLIDPGLLLDNLSGMLSSMEDYDAIRKVVNNMPTAYDADNVVEQLEERTAFLKDCSENQQQAKSYSTMLMYDVADLVKDLIEIVKRGGING